ncbi:type VI secretion system contractile sheath large subunit [Niveispirillum sp. SYP-B3756]|uniref:type VI secretion system contractile sheath large subunit n=1 Tax=Niveispirillum sp. SYP-B3756 TaxID=2662178 RepID=UPI001291CFF6|nr:type VI secretion system contractile sheath large subunit [Niveispirillum sp. SYP-B3756]MQP64867.1 type VI secretion system contractile sheath large subunit [Niveispirillum sp. SYP-B3756]
MSTLDQDALRDSASAAVADDLDIDAILSQVSAPLEKNFEKGLEDRAKLGVAWLMRSLRAEDKLDIAQLDGRLIDQLVQQIDEKLTDQVNAIMHHDDFRKMESAWRSVQFLVERTDFRQNIKLTVLNVTKEELATDMASSNGDPSTTKLYQHLYSPNLGTYGGSPFGAMIGNYDFGPASGDVATLRGVAAVAAMAHAPFIAAANPKMLSLNNFKSLHQRGDIKGLMEGDQFTKWNSLRQTEDARYIGLTLPRFVLRLPYGPDNPVRATSFSFKEPAAAEDDAYLWGNSAFAFASRLTASFAESGWCSNIIGPRAGGRVADLPVHIYEQKLHDDDQDDDFDDENGAVPKTRLVSRPPLEIDLTNRRDTELQEAGFIPLVMHQGKDEAVFFSAQSIQKPKFFGTRKEDKEAEFNYRLSTQLPYMFIISRLAHYVKAIQTEDIGSSLTRQQLETKLQNWVAQYVAAHDNPGADILRKRPLRAANIEVSDIEGEPGWYRVGITVTPHYKYQGAYFTLSLSGRMEKKLKK